MSTTEQTIQVPMPDPPPPIASVELWPVETIIGPLPDTLPTYWVVVRRTADPDDPIVVGSIWSWGRGLTAWAARKGGQDGGGYLRPTRDSAARILAACWACDQIDTEDTPA